MLIMRPSQRSQNQALTTRMKPARQTNAMSVLDQDRVDRPVEVFARREVPMASGHGHDPGPARGLQSACLRLVGQHQRAISAGNAGWDAAASSASMLEPRPEISTAVLMRDRRHNTRPRRIDTRSSVVVSMAPSRTRGSPRSTKTLLDRRCLRHVPPPQPCRSRS